MTTTKPYGRIEVWKADGAKDIHHFTTPYGKPGGPTLKDLQSYVGGYIEIVPYFHDYQGNRVVVFCNEDGKLDGLLYNQAATEAWHQNPKVAGCDVLVGDVAVCFGDDAFLDSL